MANTTRTSARERHIHGGMARRKTTNELWAVLEPLLTVFTPSPKGGRRRKVGDRATLNGILYVMQTGITCLDLPQQAGFGSDMTCPKETSFGA
ncbi:transposase [Paraburkholderia dinghuensis]|uniref:Transposase n=1 Tax=Paraburkholderia dinghuensis TaxID=2305225 RepID=A0A3N6MGS2_9BURK|nr:transposase [Paraburkholderia dinghuensis]